MKKKLARVEATDGAPRVGHPHKKRKVERLVANSGSETDWVAQMDDDGEYVESEDEIIPLHTPQGKGKGVARDEEDEEMERAALPPRKKRRILPSSPSASSSPSPTKPKSTASNSKVHQPQTTTPLLEPELQNFLPRHSLMAKPDINEPLLPSLSPSQPRSSKLETPGISRPDSTSPLHHRYRTPDVVASVANSLPSPSLTPNTPTPSSSILPIVPNPYHLQLATPLAEFQPTLLCFLTHLSPALAAHSQLFLLSGLTSLERLTNLLRMDSGELLDWMAFLKVGAVLEADEGETVIVKGLAPFLLNSVLSKGLTRVRKEFSEDV
ncbi:hypothetical protein P7C70_g4493, partial [Phenoliferia sp. Uapishka_3]